jgi:cell fate regulator YaaT (PSP1 superfamily)
MYDSNREVFRPGCAKLDTYDWLKNIELAPSQPSFGCVEVRFKNSRKDFFKINGEYNLTVGDLVAVEASPGHDIGIVTLTGETCRLQMKKKNLDPHSESLRKIYRRARATDIEKWIASVDAEDDTMYRSRIAAADLGLEMKISDVEYQGDGTKAVFYYTADDRVDFRKLIRVLAELFHVRIEMRQIGVRQEASRLGGLGSCGRELCCATWLTRFRSVTTHAARIQQLALNPQKLAGQCGKLKCCINYEYDIYLDAARDLPDHKIKLQTKKGTGTFVKADALNRLIWYAYEHDSGNLIAIPVDSARHVMQMNSKGEKPEKLEDFVKRQERKVEFGNTNDQFDVERFDR